MRPCFHRGAAALIAVCSVACGGSRGHAVSAAPVPAADSAPAAAARYPYTEADVAFMSHMIGHHAQAIVMAGWAPTHGASPSVRTLAARIINAQQDEIATMQQWLRRPPPAGARAETPAG